jgi:hypothetical protein
MSSPTELAWDECPDEDFQYSTVYGSAAQQLDSTATIIGYTADASMDISSHVYACYHVTSTDYAGNEGDESSVQNAYADAPGIGGAPTEYALSYCGPSPFSGEAVIAFDLPESGLVWLAVYDTRGRLVRRLVDATPAAGRHSVAWRGDDDAGKDVGPGIYFVRMNAGGFTAVRKVGVLR